MCSLVFSVLSYNFHKFSRSAPRGDAPRAFITSQKLFYRLYIPLNTPRPAEGRIRCISSFLRVTFFGSSETFNGHSWVGKLVAYCAHLDSAYLSILPWEYFFYSSQRSLSTWWVLVYHQLQPLGCRSYPSISSECSAFPLHRIQNIFTRFWINLYRFCD